MPEENKSSTPGSGAKHTMPSRSRKSRAFRAMVRLLVLCMIAIGLSTPIVENVSNLYCLEVGGTHYDAGEEWFEMCTHLTHPLHCSGTFGSTACRDGSDSYDIDIDAAGLPNRQADIVFFVSSVVFLRGDTVPPSEPAPLLYRPPKYA